MTSQYVLLALGVFAGALTQRVTGIGFALVCAPLLVLVVGPFQGIVLSNLLALVVSALVFVTSRRHCDWGKALLLGVPSLVAIPIGAYVAHHLPSAPLEVFVGALVILALGAVTLFPRARVFRGRAGAVAAGAGSGFMNVTAGVGGPAIVMYAVSTEWKHERFVATFQFYSIFVNVASLAAKGGLPAVPGVALGAAFLGLGAGLGSGHLLARRVDGAPARRLAIGLALVGAAATVVKGLLAW